MPTIGGKKKSKKDNEELSTKRPKKVTLPQKGFKRVFNSVVGGKGAYEISNKDQLAPYFNKNGTLKKSALRSNKQRAKFNTELAKAKEEIREQQRERREQREREREEKREKREQIKKQKEDEENKRLKSELKKALAEIERLKKEKEELERKAKEEKEQQEKSEKEKRREKAKKDKEKREKQKETYKENHEDEDVSQYEDFIDILDAVYDEVDLYFYDSDQVMRMMDTEGMTYKDIVDFLVALNKDKERELTNVEKKLLQKDEKQQLKKADKDKLHIEVAQSLYLSSKSDLKPEQWYNLKRNDYPKYIQTISKILTPEEMEELENDIK